MDTKICADIVVSPEKDANLVEIEEMTESNIVEDVAGFICRFVFLREQPLYDLAALWIIATYLKDQFDYFGYLFAYSAEPQSGKSRFLAILDYLVKDSSSRLVSPTEAVLFRAASQETLLLDEVDTWSHTDSLKAVLNAGFERRTGVRRAREVDGRYELEKHSVFGPKALAGIGMNVLPRPTRDRTFMFEMVRQTKGERRERLNIRKIEPEAHALKEKILKWSEANRNQVQQVYDDAEATIPYLDEFGDRTIDIALPLAAVTEVVYSNNSKLEMARTTLKQALSITRNEQQSSTEQHKIVEQLLAIGHLTEEDPLVGNPSELSEQFARALKDNVPPEMISAVLRQYGFKTKICRKGPGDPKYRYELPMDKLEDIIERYGAMDRPSPKPAKPAPEWSSRTQT
jgi:hypothetical protein